MSDNINLNLNEWIEKFDNGEFDDVAINIQIYAGWYDWFCEDDELVGRLQLMGPKVKEIALSEKFDNEKVYVFFKNNCPGDGELYDDFRICDIETDNVLYTVIPRSGHRADHGQAEVWGQENNFNEELVQGRWDDVRKFFWYTIPLYQEEKANEKW